MMEDHFSLSHLFLETAICAGIHIVFGVAGVEPVLEGVATGIKGVLGMPVVA